LAANVSGPRRLGFGTFRDYLLGVSLINDQGQEVKAGGRVVKNVAGYDLCKLVVGSLGTLGILTQVTLKVRPRPEQTALATIACDGPSLGALLDRLHGSRARPVCVEVLNPRAAAVINRQAANLLPASAWVIVVGFEDNREAAPWQAQQLIKEVPTGLSRSWDVRVGTATDHLWKVLTGFPTASEPRLSLKANVLPRDVASFCMLADARPEGLLIQAHAGNGIVLAHAPDNLTAEGAAAMLQVLTDAAGKSAGNVIVARCPVEWKTTLPVWGRPRPDLGLMRRVKEKLDPKRLFNPGRFLQGI
jgi:glycolate oxidase FAD binding subunit